MKKLIYFIIALLVSVLSTVSTYSQVPPPPPDPGQGPCNHGGTPVGGPNAPVGDGILVLVVLAASYGMAKYRSGNKEELPG